MDGDNSRWRCEATHDAGPLARHQLCQSHQMTGLSSLLDAVLLALLRP